MKLNLSIILVFYVSCLFAQKPVIDNNAYNCWPNLDYIELSSNGKYVVYNIKNTPLGSETLVVQATDRSWKKTFLGVTLPAYFSSDNKSLFLKNGKDSLVRLFLGTDSIKHIATVSTFKMQAGKRDWLSYTPTNRQEVIILHDLKSDRKIVYQHVRQSEFSQDGSTIILTENVPGQPARYRIHWVDLVLNRMFNIWEGGPIENLILDQRHRQLVFKTGDSIWHYNRNLNRTICIFKSSLKEILPELSVSSLYRFSKDGSRLFLYLKEAAKSKTVSESVEIWSYRDIKLLPEQEAETNSKSYLSVLDLSTFKLTRIQKEANEQFSFPSGYSSSDTLAFVQNTDRVFEPWSVGSKTVNSLISTKTGHGRILNFLNNNRTVGISARGKYLLYYDNKMHGYFSYEIATGRVNYLTQDLNVSWKRLYRDDIYKDERRALPRDFNKIIWLEDDESVLVYDSYDIWKLDLQNRKRPLNLTNAYGKRNHMVFNLAFEEGSSINGTKLYLTAFNTDNKNNGFYLKQLDKIGDPQLLTMGPYIYCTNSSYIDGTDFNPIKAKNAVDFIVRRMSAKESPNYFSTKDFKTFIKLSELSPEKKYNWFSTELHSWKSLDGRYLKGILYKPENFDLNKKYPVIFYYYERLTDGLNAYLKPDFSHGTLDIPSYVSQGYLVFVPDIFYKVGNPMQGTYDALVSAAQYLAELPFVDAKKMGIQGHSFGGVQTNYLVTHTNLFAAAVSASGLADLVSGYGGLIGDMRSLQDINENGQNRMGGSLWEIPEAYINNSSIFSVDKVTTPLLIMHTKKDFICPYSNALEFFTGLRRMGKKAWLLTYAKGNHTLNGKESEDFSIRMMQFFNHYLKDKPAPVWMTRGINPNQGAFEKGYEFDTNIKTPGPGLLKADEQLKVDSLMAKRPLTINF